MPYPVPPRASSSWSSSPGATSSVVTGSAKLPVWQPPVYLVVALVIVTIIAGVILLIWNVDSIESICRCVKIKSMGLESALRFLSASALVETMFRFFMTRLQAFRGLGQTAALSLGSSVAPRRHQLALPLFRPPGFREPLLTVPRPALPHDVNSFRIQSNRYSGPESSSFIPPITSFPSFFGPVGSAPQAPFTLS